MADTGQGFDLSKLLGTTGQIMGGLGSLFQGFGLGDNPQEWIQNALVGLYQRAQQGDEMGRQLFAMFADPARQNALNLSDGLARPAIDIAPYLLQWGEQFKNSIDPTISSYGNQAQGLVDPANAGLAGLLGGLGESGDLARAGFAGGGWSQQSQDIFDVLNGIMSGRGSNSQMALNDVGSNLIGQRGQTAFTQNAADRGIEASLNKGMNPTLEAAMAGALDTLSTGGYNAATSELGRRGSDMIQAAFNKAMSGGLMSPQQAADWAREQAFNVGEKQRESFYDNISRLGGGPATLGSGLQNQKKMDFADAIQQNATQAARDAFMKQQELMLQDKGIAGSLVGQGSNLALGAENAAAQRTGQAFGAIPGTQNAATGVMEALLQSALGAGNLENSRMGTGANMANSFINSILGGAQAGSSNLSNQNQYALGLGNLSNSLANSQANIWNSQANNNLGAGQLGNALAGTSINGQQAALSGLGTNWNNIAQNYLNAQNPLTQLAGNALNYAGNNVSLMGVPFQGMNYTGQGQGWTNGLIQAGQALQRRSR